MGPDAQDRPPAMRRQRRNRCVKRGAQPQSLHRGKEPRLTSERVPSPNDGHQWENDEAPIAQGKELQFTDVVCMR